MKFNALQEFLTDEMSAKGVAEELDDIIFTYIFVYGDKEGDVSIKPSVFADQIYTLRRLRDVFRATEKENA